MVSPESKAQMGKTFPDIVWHYTSHDAALSIVRNKQLWLSNLRYLSDAGEYVWIFDVIKEYLGTRKRDDAPVHPAIKSRLMLHASKRDLGISICISCFSSIPDDEAQWERYASGGQGVAVGFKADELAAAVATKHWGCLGPVTYDTSSRSRQVAAAITYAEECQRRGKSILGTRESILAQVAALSKHESFSSEKEFRLVLYGVPYTMYEFLPRDDTLIPYTVLPISPTCVRSIRVGPRSLPECLNAWRLLLAQIGHGMAPPHIELCRSRSSLR